MVITERKGVFFRNKKPSADHDLKISYPDDS